MSKLLLVFVVIAVAATASHALPRASASSVNRKHHVDVAAVKPKQDDTQWTRHAVLDKIKDGKIHLFWNYDKEQQELLFEVQAQVTGWVGVGFSPNGGMTGADIVTCWVKDGVQHFHDRHANQPGLPTLDASQDYTLISATENGTHTICRFSRKVDTCDLDQDYFIQADTIRVIYAFGETDPEGDDPFYHQGNRGTVSLYILDPPTGVVVPDPATTESFDIVTPYATIQGTKDTTYICSIHKGPEIQSKRHIIGYVPTIIPENKDYVHHALVYQCFFDNMEEEQLMEQFVGKHAECYGSRMPGLWGRCNSVFVAWAIGSEGQMYPENVGFPMKRQSDGPAFFMLEMHYNNPTFQTFRDSSGIRVYHTDIIRQQEMGVLELGITVTPFQIIPPNQKSFKTSAICTASCTQNGFPAEGVSVFAGLLHSHLLGRKMKLRLIRNGVEEPWFQFDDHYDFDFQETRVYPEEKKILPGDIFILECTLDSTARTGVTTGGWGTDDEMCLAFLSYYPRSDLMRCFTFFDFDLMQAQMGFPDLFADGNSLTWMVDQNTTWKEYLNNKYAPWSQETVDMFQQIAALQISQSFGFCLNEGSNVIQDAESISGYPDMQEYEPPPRDCPTKKSPERVPIEMTKSLKLAFPRMAATNGHFFKRLPKV